MATINYIAVLKQLESGKFLISFPDFEGITTTAETEESIQTAASGILKNKLAELKKANIEPPEPKKIAEVSKELKDGEFTTYIIIKEIFDLKSTMNSFKDKEAVKETAKEMTNRVNKFFNNVPEEKENLFAMGGGVLSILNTLFLAIITIKVPLFGNYSIGFFKGLGVFSDFDKNIKNARFILMFSGILFLVLAGFLIYSSFIRNRNFLKYSIFANIAFLIIFYVILYVKLSKEGASSYVSVSYFKIFLYIISIGLSYLSFNFFIKKKENNSEKDMKLINNETEGKDAKSE